jgi:hypothetical protein
VKLRMSIRMSLILVALAGAILGFLRWNDPAVRYRRDHDEASLNAVLSGRIVNGDSIQTVESKLGRSVVSTDPKLIRSAASFALQNPKGWPQGFREDDEFHKYQSGQGQELVLQFRAGRLVNFNPSEFATASVPTAGISK